MSIEDETKRLLAEVNADDSKDTTTPIKKEKKVNDEYNEYEMSDSDPLKDENLDDKEW